jgi:hypothetical protein
MRVVIEIDSAADPIEGAVIEPGQAATRFRGWLQLTALIERARTIPDAPPELTTPP